MHQWGEFILIYPKGIEVVKNTDARYDIYSRQGDYTSPTFYAAANPDQYDQSVFTDSQDVLLSRQNNNIYHAKKKESKNIFFAKSKLGSESR